MWKKLTIIALVLAFAPPAFAQNNPPKSRGNSELPDLGQIRKNRHIGVGIGSGTLASGFSAKYIMSDALSVQANLGGCHRCAWFANRNWNWGNYGGFAVSADLLMEMPAFETNEFVRLGWNFGASAGIGVPSFGGVLALAPALVGGVTLEFRPLPIDFVLEWRPNLRLFLGGGGGVYADIIFFTGHLRFYIL